LRNSSKVHRVHALVVTSLLALVLSGVAQAAVDKRAATTVTVTITDRTLRVSPTNPESGSTKFLVVNKGKKRHFFSISGPGVAAKKTGKIEPGKSATLTVTLRPGAYVLSDPIGLGTYTSAFLDVIRASVLSGRGNGNKVQDEVAPPEMCGVYFSP
jgi:cupredoxin-like protein